MNKRIKSSIFFLFIFYLIFGFSAAGRICFAKTGNAEMIFLTLINFNKLNPAFYCDIRYIESGRKILF